MAKRQATKRGRGRTKTVLSLFTGAGGLDLGLEAAGFDVRLCVENDLACRKTLAANRPHWALANPGDIHKLKPTEALDQAGVKPGDLTVLAGGPPCQPFSKSSFWLRGETRRMEDPRAATLEAFLDYVDAARPQVMLLENVRGLVFNGKNEGFELLEQRLRRTNERHGVAYTASVITINCADFGVPQLRERIFVVAARDGSTFTPPRPTHLAPNLITNGEQRHRTAWDAIGDLDDEDWPAELGPTGKWADLLPSIPEGDNYLWHTKHSGGEPLFGWRSRYWSFLLKLAKDRPSWTIQAAPGPATGPFHWRSRQLSIRELGRLQTFPDDFKILGEYRSCHRQIGNAVPPAIGAMLGREITRQLLSEPAPARSDFVPPARDDCPRPQKRGRVPTRFLDLQGDHKDHPGTGRGPGALRREAEGK